MSHPRLETKLPELGYCPFCQRTGVAAYRVRRFGLGPGCWHCRRCGAVGPAVDRRAPMAEWKAFELAMRVEPRRVHDARGRFKRVEPVGGRDGAGETEPPGRNGA